jgi:hypothetical protein
MPQVQREIVDRLGKCCLTLGHQQPLQTICSSLEAAASYLVYVMKTTLSKHMSIIYWPS